MVKKSEQIQFSKETKKSTNKYINEDDNEVSSDSDEVLIVKAKKKSQKEYKKESESESESEESFEDEAPKLKSKAKKASEEKLIKKIIYEPPEEKPKVKKPPTEAQINARKISIRKALAAKKAIAEERKRAKNEWLENNGTVKKTAKGKFKTVYIKQEPKNPEVAGSSSIAEVDEKQEVINSSKKPGLRLASQESDVVKTSIKAEQKKVKEIEDDDDDNPIFRQFKQFKKN